MLLYLSRCQERGKSALPSVLLLFTLLKLPRLIETIDANINGCHLSHSCKVQTYIVKTGPIRVSEIPLGMDSVKFYIKLAQAKCVHKEEQNAIQRYTDWIIV